MCGPAKVTAWVGDTDIETVFTIEIHGIGSIDGKRCVPDHIIADKLAVDKNFRTEIYRLKLKDNFFAFQVRVKVESGTPPWRP